MKWKLTTWCFDARMLVRHPGLKVSTPAHAEHPSWCVDVGFRGNKDNKDNVDNWDNKNNINNNAPDAAVEVVAVAAEVHTVDDLVASDVVRQVVVEHTVRCVEDSGVRVLRRYVLRRASADGQMIINHHHRHRGGAVNVYGNSTSTGQLTQMSVPSSTNSQSAKKPGSSPPRTPQLWLSVLNLQGNTTRPGVSTLVLAAVLRNRLAVFPTIRGDWGHSSGGIVHVLLHSISGGTCCGETH